MRVKILILTVILTLSNFTAQAMTLDECKLKIGKIFGISIDKALTNRGIFPNVKVSEEDKIFLSKHGVFQWSPRIFFVDSIKKAQESDRITDLARNSLMKGIYIVSESKSNKEIQDHINTSFKNGTPLTSEFINKLKNHISNSQIIRFKHNNELNDIIPQITTPVEVKLADFNKVIDYDNLRTVETIPEQGTLITYDKTAWSLPYYRGVILPEDQEGRNLKSIKKLSRKLLAQGYTLRFNNDFEKSLDMLKNQKRITQTPEKFTELKNKISEIIVSKERLIPIDQFKKELNSLENLVKNERSDINYDQDFESIISSYEHIYKNKENNFTTNNLKSIFTGLKKELETVDKIEKRQEQKINNAITNFINKGHNQFNSINSYPHQKELLAKIFSAILSDNKSYDELIEMTSIRPNAFAYAKIFLEINEFITYKKNFLEIGSGLKSIQAKIRKLTSDTTNRFASEDAINELREGRAKGVIHSVEVWDENEELKGGLILLDKGNFYEGDTVFYQTGLDENGIVQDGGVNFAKVSLLFGIDQMRDANIKFMDAAMVSPFTRLMKGKEISRDQFLQLLIDANSEATIKIDLNNTNWAP